MTAGSLFNTSVMGMSAQATALSAIAENISNSGAVGYKEATTQFSTLLSSFGGGTDSGGGVEADTRIAITAQGTAQFTSSSTDLAIKGSGFFVVSDASGAIFLTRAGSFVPDAEGRLVNSAGYYLMGNSDVNAAPSDVAQMQAITVSMGKLIANPSTSGALSANLQQGASAIAAADLPSVNAVTSSYTSKTSLTAYDNLGNPIKLDVYFSKTATNSWEMSVYDAAGAATGGGFPYSGAALLTQTLTFDPGNGALLSGNPATIPVPGGALLSLDIGDMTQLGAPFGVNSSTINGNAASAVNELEVSNDGTLSYRLGNGQIVPAYKIALAAVPSPYGLAPVTGNAFAKTIASGEIFVGAPGTGSFGTIGSSQLEGSTVDLASQLSAMIVAQRSYTANSQVFQVASEVMQVLNNLK
ncbi:MAG: flagellar hook protein FlgE [Methylocystaceae bacterium]|nr:MAG: flagellar hook protein FlgE [Methylocystaceae bacterium]